MTLEILAPGTYTTFFYSWAKSSEGGASNVPFFFGVCAFAGCYLLANINGKKNP
jgi:hypothetical protein